MIRNRTPVTGPGEATAPPPTQPAGPGGGSGYGSAAAFGSFGELLQGALPDGADFLVTLPITRGSRARFRLDPADPALRVRPPHKTKSARLAAELLARHGVGAGGVLLLESDLPEGTGLASSSADLVATARAVAMAIGVDPEPGLVESLMRRIEPSDGVMYDGVVAFHHRAVRVAARLGHLPALTIVGIDEGGGISTVEFNRRPKDYSVAERRTYEEMLAALGRAISLGDVATVGEIATRSAMLNQRLCHKRTLERMHAICVDAGGLGVVAAHSGTALGILLADHHPGHRRRLERVAGACRELSSTVWIDHSLPTSPPGPGSGRRAYDGNGVDRPIARRKAIEDDGGQRRGRGARGTHESPGRRAMADAGQLNYQVVINDEEQYSIWPTGRDLPAGWHREGTEGSEDECVAHIDRVWTDMRPRSVR